MQLMCYENASFPYILFKLISNMQCKTQNTFRLEDYDKY